MKIHIVTGRRRYADQQWYIGAFTTRELAEERVSALHQRLAELQSSENYEPDMWGELDNSTRLYIAEHLRDASFHYVAIPIIA